MTPQAHAAGLPHFSGQPVVTKKHVVQNFNVFPSLQVAATELEKGWENVEYSAISSISLIKCLGEIHVVGRASRPMAALLLFNTGGLQQHSLHANFILPLLRAFSGIILWAITAELLFSTTAKRRKTRSSKWIRKRNCSFHMGLRVLRWMGFVRKWQLSRGIPSTSTSMHGLPVLLLGHTFCPDTIWNNKKKNKRTMW